MVTGLEKYLTDLLGSATALGAMSWLQAFTWVATLVAAMIAGVSLRRNSLQNRATLLLNLYKSWNDLAQPRDDFSQFYQTIQQRVIQQNSNLQEKYQRDQMRIEFEKELTSLRDNDNTKFSKYYEYLIFFELLGVYVRNGYIPVRDVIQIYDVPIRSIDIAWRRFIAAWERQIQVPSGLMEHAIFLMDMTRTRSERPIYYWTVYRFYRSFR